MGAVGSLAGLGMCPVPHQGPPQVRIPQVGCGWRGLCPARVWGRGCRVPGQHPACAPRVPVPAGAPVGRAPPGRALQGILSAFLFLILLFSYGSSSPGMTVLEAFINRSESIGL